MTTRLNTAEGGTSTTAVSAANSGGTSGDAFSGVIGTAPTFTAATPAAGSLAYSAQAASGATSILQWTGFSGNDFGDRVAIYLPAWPSQSTEVIQLRSASAAQARVLITNTGKVQLNDFAQATAWLSTNTLSTGTWYEIAVRAKKGTGTTDGQLQVAYYLFGSNTAIETFANLAANAGTNTFTETRVGKVSASTSVGAILLDNVQATDVAAGALLPAYAPVVVTPPSTITLTNDYVVAHSGLTPASSYSLADHRSAFYGGSGSLADRERAWLAAHSTVTTGSLSDMRRGTISA